jgi:release factor glutamine methyltransferase
VDETRGSLVVEATAVLSEVGIEEPRRRARILVAAALNISRADLFGHPNLAVDKREIGLVKAMLRRMVDREPLSRILGRREFWGLEFTLSAETLDPRPESETLVEAVLSRNPDRGRSCRFLDLGTGTGCILLALLHEFPKAIGIGIDIAESAARTAAGNAARLGFANRAFFFVGDWAAAVAGNFAAVIANPPYIARADLKLLPREVACYDPPRALNGGEDGLAAYRAIAKDVPKVLAPDGIFVAEVGVDQADSIATIMKLNGLILDGIERDLAGNNRCVVARQQPN